MYDFETLRTKLNKVITSCGFEWEGRGLWIHDGTPIIVWYKKFPKTIVFKIPDNGNMIEYIKDLYKKVWHYTGKHGIPDIIMDIIKNNDNIDGLWRNHNTDYADYRDEQDLVRTYKELEHNLEKFVTELNRLLEDIQINSGEIRKISYEINFEINGHLDCKQWTITDTEIETIKEEISKKILDDLNIKISDEERIWHKSDIVWPKIEGSFSFNTVTNKVSIID